MAGASRSGNTCAGAGRHAFGPRGIVERLGRLAWVISLALALCGCPPPALEADAGFPALSPTLPGALTRIVVRHFDARPRLALVIREGDPSPALALAVFTGTPPTSTVALATLVERRLRQAGFEQLDLTVDRAAFRLVWWPADSSRVEAFVAAAAGAFGAPAAPDGGLREQLSARLASLRRHPLAAAALEPLAACSGQLGIVPSPEDDADVDTTLGALEAQRRSSLAASRTALAAVGPEAFGRATVEALESGPQWPNPPASSDDSPRADQAAVYPSPSIPPGSARLHWALAVADPQRAASAAARMGTRPSPLLAKLAALPVPWRLRELSATASPSGGCIRALLGPASKASVAVPTDAADSAARAAALLRDEFYREISRPPDAHRIATQVTAAADPRSAAEQAAWWSLAARAPNARREMSVALGLPSPSAQAAEHAAATDEAAADRLTETLASLDGASASTPLAPRVAVERGQGRMWALLASPCVLEHEGPDETGAAALAVLSALASAPRVPGVTLEPWIAPGGVGFIAHAAPRSPSESPEKLARRLGRILGRAAAVERLGPSAYASAQGRLARALRRGEERYLERFCAAALPDHPSWLRPLGALEQHMSADRHTVERRWHQALRAPLRLAVIANAAPGQANALAAEVDRWLLPAARGTSCPQRADPASPKLGLHRLERAPAGARYVVLGLRLPRGAPDDALLAELTAHLLRHPDGPVAHAVGPPRLADGWSVRLLGGKRAAALMVSAAAAPGKQKPLREALGAVMDHLQTAGPESSLAARVTAELAEQQREAALDPRQRLERLWRGEAARQQVAPDLTRWRAWLARALAPANRVAVAPPVED